MGLISRLLGSNQAEQRSVTSLEELARLFGADVTVTGRAVSAEGSLAQVTVYSCVRLIAESVGMLPIILYRRLERGKERATEHPLYSILHTLPNPEMTPIELFETVTGHLCLWGNAYCEIEYDGAGRRRALWPLRPNRMTVEVNANNEREYEYMLPDGKSVRIPRWRIWHVRGWGTDAWCGKSPITVARESIALALATQEYGARFFGNDSRPGGILVHPGKLSKDTAGKLKAQWEAAHSGLSNSHRVAVLEEGISWQQIGIPPEDAQFLQTREYQDVQICTLYRVPPHMVGITDKSTSWGSGIEQQALGYQTFTLLPYTTRICQSITRDLLSASERNTLFAEYLTAALVKGDIKTRYESYAIGRNGGWLSVNDVREAENMNPVDGGDEYLQPMNMQPVGQEPEEPEEPEPDQPEPDEDDAGGDGQEEGDDETQD